MRVRFVYFIFILSLAAFLASGCKKGSDEQTQLPKEETGQTAESQDPSVISDAEITASVKARFMTDENVAARKIDVDTNNGVVTLRGTVATPREADRAIELAKAADGVRLVHSYLKTDTTSEAENEAQDAISDLGDKAQDALNDAGGAIETGVEEAQDTGSDAAITAQIKWKLAKDKLVQAADIDVDTKDRHVTLTGTVSSKQEVQRALQIANSVEDVLAVDSNLRIR